MSKTVYILGAGFSMDAGIPSQAGLIEKIINLDTSSDDILESSLANFRDKLSKQFLIPPEKHAQVPLEDIFTPIDRSLIDSISFRTMNQTEMQNLKEDIFYLIGKTIDDSIAPEKTDYIKNFSAYLLTQSKARIQGNSTKDPVSVISTNWDILLDKTLRADVQKYNSSVTTDDDDSKSLKNKCVVDYCCYMSSYDPNDHLTKPGLEAIGAGGFNIKLLKVHGSLNWLQCPRCARVYVSFDEKIALLRHEKRSNCRHCENNYGTDTHLIANVIMPTFLKNFLKTQYKLIWDNAGIELAEASKIIFVGYSLPQADFEMRQLLSRMVRDNVEIEVVTYGCPQASGLKDRYEIFFGKREIKWHQDGARAYFNSIS